MRAIICPVPHMKTRYSLLARIVLCCWLCLHGLNGQSQTGSHDNALEVSGANANQLLLAPWFQVLEDRQQTFTIEQVRSMGAHFQPSPAGAQGRELHFGFTRSAWWLRLHLKNTSELDIDKMVEIKWAHLERIEVWQSAADGSLQLQRAGNAVAFSDWPYPHRFPVFPLRVGAYGEQILYFRIAGPDRMEIPATLWSPGDFHSHELSDYMLQAGFFGLALALIVFNLLLFLTLRSLSYLWYVCYSLCVTATIASHTGLANEWINAGAGHWITLSTQTGLSLSAVGLLVFMRRMLGTRQLVPALDRLLVGMIVIHLTLPLLLMLSFYHAIMLAMVCDASAALLVFYTSCVCAWRRQRNAGFFVGSLAMIVISLVPYSIHSFNLIPASFFTDDGLQLGAAIQMLVLAYALLDQYYVMRREKAQAQATTWQARQNLVENLRSSGHLLEQRVVQRTTELSENNRALSTTHQQLQTTLQAAQASRLQAEQAEQQAARSLEELRQAQQQLVQSEKMAALGQLIAGVAHEINTPIGAIKSSGHNIADNLAQGVQGMAELFQSLDADKLPLFIKLIDYANSTPPMRSTREERALVQQTSALLEQAGVKTPRHHAAILVQMHAHASYQAFLPLLQGHEGRRILDCAHQIANIIGSANNINLAVERVGKIIFALKSFSQFDPSSEMETCKLEDGLETVLRIYQSQIGKKVHLVRHYQEIAPLLCFPDQLNQVWTNLIHNALQAMHYQGTITLEISCYREDDRDYARVGISDNGPGIPDAIRSKIFDAFFTTKPPGEGTGLGLDIVKKIIEQHHGKIEVQSPAGSGTSFIVSLPYPVAAGPA
ncbi:MAG: hypothetical protein RL748_3017 [Pseudomonadota bacterium]